MRHVRHSALHRDFRHRGYLWLVDLDALPRLPLWLRPFARFAARDHLGDPRGTIRANLDRYLAGHGIDLRGGRVLMLANARVLGHVFNPLTVYWCHLPDGPLACVVAEVHNTYGERHCYLLHTDTAGRARVDKEFYVSPFLAVDGEYRMHLPVPDDGWRSRSRCAQNGSTALVATVAGVRGRRHPAARSARVAGPPPARHACARRPCIRRHGIALWLRRLPVIPRPRHAPQEGVQ